MKKFAIVLMLLMLAASLAVADEANNALTDNLGDEASAGNTDETTGSGAVDGSDGTADKPINEGDGSKAIAPTPMPTVAESDTAVGKSLARAVPKAVSVVRNAISRIHLTGSGIAVSEDDAFNFLHAKVIVGVVRVKPTSDDGTSEAFVAKRLGILMLDGQKYRLMDVAVSGEEVSAEIYGPAETDAAASAPVGEIKVKRFEKPGRDIWAGNMVLNNEAYNVYFMGMKRQFKLAEVTEKLGEYCSSNTNDARCKNIVSTCIQNPEQCKERVTDYCKNNPSDLKCLQLKKLYCLGNASDERCREYLKGLCEEHPELAHCRIRAVAGKAVAGINAEKVSAITAEKGEKARSLIASKVREKLRVLKNKIESVDANPVAGED